MLCRIINIGSPAEGGMEMDVSGKYFVTIVFILVLIIINIILISPVTSATNHTYSELENNYNSFNLSNNILRLPVTEERSQNSKVFSQRGQEKLLNIALLYREEDVNFSLQVPVKSMDKNIQFNNVNSINFEPLPDIEVNANYDQEQEGQKKKIEKNINLEYQMNERTWLRAGYLLANKEWWDIKQISLQKEEIGESEVFSTASEQKDGIKTDGVQQLIEAKRVYSLEQAHKSNFGISYKTSDRVTVSADYISGDVFTGDTSSTILGLEYVDDQGKLRAKYKVDQGEEMKETVTGLELDLKDLVTFSASYKLLDPKLLRNQLYNKQGQLNKSLNEEAVWDFGVDFNLSDVSSLSIGYKLINNKESEEKGDSKEDKEEKESSIKASFQIEF